MRRLGDRCFNASPLAACFCLAPPAGPVGSRTATSCFTAAVRCRVAGANPATGRPTLARLHLLPASGPSFGAAWQGPKVVTGQNKSATSWWQGWYSQTYTGHSPAPTLVYDAAIDGNATWAWLLVPAASGNTTGPATATLADAGPTHATVEVVLNGVKTVLELPLEQAV